MKRTPLIIIAAIFLLCSCTLTRNATDNVCTLDWSDSINWYQTGNPIDDNKVDVIYFASTVVAQERDQNGNPLMRILLTEDEAYQLDRDSNHYKRDMFTYENFNFFSPHYHQGTMEVLTIPEDQQTELWDEVGQEVCEAFDYYMENLNNGRKFILAGFSQGARMIISVLKHMTDEQFSKMICAYMIGYGISEEDIAHPHVNPATGADDLGVVISFNSVYSLDGVYDALMNNAAASINPTNWCTDNTPGTALVNDTEVTVTLDTNENVLVVTGYDFSTMSEQLKEGLFFPKGCLHLLDFRIYEKYLTENAIHRSYEL